MRSGNVNIALGSFRESGDTGRWWSKVVADTGRSGLLTINNQAVDALNGGARIAGYSLRCLAD